MAECRLWIEKVLPLQGVRIPLYSKTQGVALGYEVLPFQGAAVEIAGVNKYIAPKKLGIFFYAERPLKRGVSGLFSGKGPFFCLKHRWAGNNLCVTSFYIQRTFTEAVHIRGGFIQPSPAYRALAAKLQLEASFIPTQYLEEHRTQSFEEFRAFQWENHLARLDSVKASSLAPDQRT